MASRVQSRLTAALGGREKYVEAQLAKRLGRTDAAAAAAAPLDAQQREEQELYGIPENLKVCGVVPEQAHWVFTSSACCPGPVTSTTAHTAAAVLSWNMDVWQACSVAQRHYLAQGDHRISCSTADRVRARAGTEA